MILTRLGNKRRIAEQIFQHFPPHTCYLEPFFGAGGMFFSKPKAKYNIVNDIDDDVFNLFQVVINRKEELENAIAIMPQHQSLLKYWQKNKETEPIKKALRFLMLSNFTYLGKDTGSFLFDIKNAKKLILENLEQTHKALFDVQFSCVDFRNFLNIIKYREKEENFFSYCDPPYIDTDNNYPSSFKENDTIDLIEIHLNKNIKFAMSEFYTDFTLKLAKDYNLNLITIGERQNIKNRKTEILLTNYQKETTLF